MQLGHHLVHDQRTRMYVTPQLNQAIRMLKLSAQELTSFLQEQCNENPFVEMDWPEPLQWKQYTIGHRTKEFDINGIPHNGVTLECEIIRQLQWENCPSELMPAAFYLAGNLDEAGYLTISLQECSENTGIPLHLVKQALNKIQTLDPPGVGAQSLQECLLLQMERDQRADPLAIEMVTRYLPELAKANYDKIADATGADRHAVIMHADYIRGLHPRPCLAQSYAHLTPIVVDAVVMTIDNECNIELNQDIIPKLSLSESYVQKFKNKSELRTYVTERLKTAKWLINGLEYRNQTLRNVIGAIVQEQQAFFEEGPNQLKPLKMEKISQMLQVHLSTVSRTVSNKYISTPHGVYPLQYFFSNGIQAADGKELSSKTVKRLMKKLIENEDRSKPLSDQQLVRMLLEQGVSISRRTVAKYREEERILSSALRKTISY